MRTLRPGGVAEGELLPEYLVVINGQRKEAGFNTYEEAYASIKHLVLGAHVQIWQGRKLVFGKPLPPYGSDDPLAGRSRRRNR